MQPIHLPPGFTLGVATSAFQIEGAWDRDGKGPSIWDTFSQTPGKVLGDVAGSDGVAHYDRLDEDLAILADLGVDSYRFSLSWPRLLPDGAGRPNEAGFDFYDRLLDGLAAAGIGANVSLYHWDLPQALEDAGGWPERDIIGRFTDYAALAFDRFGDRVERWATLNEPIALWVGYGMGVFAPGRASAVDGKQAMHNAMVAHGAAVRAFRDSAATGDIGIAIDVWKRHALTDSAADLRLAAQGEDESFRFFFDELFAGGLSDRIVDQLERDGTLPDIRDGDFETAAAQMDFLGLNIYARVLVDSTKPSTNWWESTDGFPGGNFLSNGTEVYPQAVTDAVRLVRDDYGTDIPILITENGTDAESSRDDVTADAERIDYLSAYLGNALEAHEAGLGVDGYYIWSLLDNYEWSSAYSRKYGLVSVDMSTFDRTYKDSARWVKALTAARSAAARPATVESEADHAH